jgi:hypothetical protein
LHQWWRYPTAGTAAYSTYREIETHNKAAICREKYAALVAVSRKMNTAAKDVYYDVGNINAKKGSSAVRSAAAAVQLCRSAAADASCRCQLPAAVAAAAEHSAIKWQMADNSNCIKHKTAHATNCLLACVSPRSPP